MFNFTLDAYGSVKRPATQNVTGGQSALLNPGAQKPAPSVETKPIEKPAVEVTKADLATAVKKLNERVSPALQTIQFSLEQDSARMVVKVIDTATKTVLRQIPNEEVLAFSKTMDRLQGMVIRQKA
jgi:flagellar protein FlaG